MRKTATSLRSQTFGCLLIAALLAATASCGDKADTGADSTIGKALAGTTKLSTDVKGQTLVDGTRLIATFDDTSMAMVAGCNVLSGQFTISGGSLKIGQLAQTKMMCSEELGKQEAWVAAFLQAGTTIDLKDDVLTLASADVTISFADRSAVANAYPFDGTVWSIKSLTTAAGVVTPPVSAQLAIYDLQMHVSTGCNTGVAGVEVGDSFTVTVGEMAGTVMDCEPALNDWETSVFTLLTGDLNYRLGDKELTFERDGTTLTLVPVL